MSSSIDSQQRPQPPQHQQQEQDTGAMVAASSSIGFKVHAWLVVNRRSVPPYSESQQCIDMQQQPFSLEEHGRFLAAVDGLAASSSSLPQPPEQAPPQRWQGDEWAALAAAVGNGRTAQEVGS